MRWRQAGGTGDRWSRVEAMQAGWYVGLVMMLAVDVAIRYTDADLPLAAVFSAWTAAFAVPFLALALWGSR